MSPAKKYHNDNLRLTNSNKKSSEGFKNESPLIRNFNPLHVIHIRNTDATNLYNDWMAFSSKFVSGIYNKI